MQSICLIVLLCLAAVQAAPTALETKGSQCIDVGIGNGKFKFRICKYKEFLSFYTNVFTLNM